MPVMSGLSYNAVSTVSIDAHQYNFTATGNYLDWLPIVACSPLVTPATNYSVTVALQSYAGMEKFTFVTNRTSIELNGIIPIGERISVSLQILEGKPAWYVMLCTEGCLIHI